MTKQLIKHYICLIIGLLLMAFAIALAKISGLGTSPISSVPNVLSFITPLTIGQTTIIFMVALIILEALILRRDFNWSNIVQLIPTLAFGIFIDAFVTLLTPLTPRTYFIKLAVVLISTALLAIGVFFEVNSRTIMMAGEGIAAAIAFRLRRPFAKIKIRCDLAMIILALIIALVFTRGLVGIREGTLLAALLTGIFLNAIEQSFPKLTTWIRD